jgi:hypothetical protein
VDKGGILGGLFNILALHLVHGGLEAPWEVVDADRAIVHVLQLRFSDMSTALSEDFCEGETVRRVLVCAQRDVQMMNGRDSRGGELDAADEKAPSRQAPSDRSMPHRRSAFGNGFVDVGPNPSR